GGGCARVEGQFLRARPDRLPVQAAQLGLAAADADGEVRRADAAALELLEEALHDPVLERMEGDHRETPAGSQHLECGRQRFLELAELVVDGDAKSLEHALGRMAVAESRRRRDRGADDLDELPGPLDRLVLAAPSN